MQATVPDPVFLNLDYIFFLIYRVLARFMAFITSGKLYSDLKIFATVIVIILITIILYCLVRLYEIKYPPKAKGVAPAVGVAGDTTVPLGDHAAPHHHIGRNEIWEGIRAKVLSDNPSDWRLGIIEADIYLDRLLDQKGVFGDTLGDKLKAMTDQQLPSLQLAWEAHKVRNRIAHEGAEYTLTQPEARRTLSYFEIVFRDLEVIA